LALSDDFVCMFPVSRTSIPGILHDDLSMLYCCRQNEMATNSLSSSEVVSDFRIAQEEKDYENAAQCCSIRAVPYVVL